MLFSRAKDLLHLFYPHTCVGCAQALMRGEEILCLTCHLDLPYARMHDQKYNVAEMRLFGRFDFIAATSLLYFLKEGRVQHMMHGLKYLGQKEIGLFFGRLLAEDLSKSKRFSNIDYVVPVPLHPRKRKLRGYNQTELIAEGMEEMGLQSRPMALRRTKHTESQTRKSMTERYRNMHKVFELGHADELRGKRVLLIDDVLTTGATLEACALQLLKVEEIELMVATVACAEY